MVATVVESNAMNIVTKMFCSTSLKAWLVLSLPTGTLVSTCSLLATPLAEAATLLASRSIVKCPFASVVTCPTVNRRPSGNFQVIETPALGATWKPSSVNLAFGAAHGTLGTRRGPLVEAVASGAEPHGMGKLVSMVAVFVSWVNKSGVRNARRTCLALGASLNRRTKSTCVT